MATAGKFRKGAEASAEASKGGGQFAKTHYFNIEDGKSEIVRFLTEKDDWIVVNQHQMIPTKPKPSGYDGNWPDKMGSVCRADEAFEGVYYTDAESRKSACYICEFMVDGKNIKKPGGRTWALAVLREEVLGDGSDDLGGPEMKGKVLGIRDQVREVAKIGEDGKPTGDTYMEKAVVVVNMGYKNFFSALTGFAGHYGTVLDRDYLVKRSGNDTSTVYQIIPLDPIILEGGKKYDLREAEFMARYAPVPDLEALITERTTDEFYGRFFDKRITVTKEGKVEASGESAPAKQENDVSADRMAALANRVKDYAPTGEAAAATETSQPAAAAATAGGMRDFG